MNYLSLARGLALCLWLVSLPAGYLLAQDQASADSSYWSSLRLWYEQPAAAWNEALPVGNGRLGAMVFGGVANEHIQLNEETLWTGGPYDPTVEGGAEALPEIRRLLFAGDQQRAHDLFGRTMMGIPYEQMKYQSLGDLRLSFEGHEDFRDYRRELDLDRAVVRVSYRVGETTYAREVFSSAPDQVIVVRLTADRPGSISFSANLYGARNTAHSNYDTAYFRMDGLPPDGLRLTGKNSDYLGVEGRLRYEARVRAIVDGGEVDVDYRTLTVRGADAVTLLIAAATSFVDYRTVGADPEARVSLALTGAAGKSFDQLLDDHLADHRRLFRRVALELPSSRSSLPTDRRKKAAESDPELAALLFQFGRYLLISSSRPGTQAANLQGIWNDSANPSWDSKYTVNINLPMNYWIAEVGNLRETFEPLRRLIRDVSESGRRVARLHWGADGWVLHQNTDIWRAAAPMDGPSWGAWPTGGAWLTTHLWEHFSFEPDVEYLRQAYPLMKGSVEFLLDILVEHPDTGWLVTAPSNSPENFPAWPGNGRFFDEVSGLFLKARTMSVGPTMDMQIFREVFDEFSAASEMLGLDEELRAEVERMRARLAPLQIGKNGQLQEWLRDWDEIEPEHRHLSHLWGLYPGKEISPETTPEFAAASRRSIEMRGTGGCGWSMAWKVGLWARLLDGERANDQLTVLLSENVLPNLFSRCGRTLQVDGNFGASAAIAEMLLQSQEGFLHFLPALPSSWETGEVRGLLARGGFEVDITWSDKNLTRAVIHSKRGALCRIKADRAIDVRSTTGESVRTRKAPDGSVEFDTSVGGRYVLIQG